MRMPPRLAKAVLNPVIHTAMPFLVLALWAVVPPHRAVVFGWSETRVALEVAVASSFEQAFVGAWWWAFPSGELREVGPLHRFCYAIGPLIPVAAFGGWWRWTAPTLPGLLSGLVGAGIVIWLWYLGKLVPRRFRPSGRARKQTHVSRTTSGRRARAEAGVVAALAGALTTLGVLGVALVGRPLVARWVLRLHQHHPSLSGRGLIVIVAAWLAGATYSIVVSKRAVRALVDGVHDHKTSRREEYGWAVAPPTLALAATLSAVFLGAHWTVCGGPALAILLVITVGLWSDRPASDATQVVTGAKVLVRRLFKLLKRRRGDGTVGSPA